MMTLIRFGLIIAGLLVLSLFWSPVLARGLWPYSETIPDSEKLVSHEREMKAMVWTAYLLFVFANALAVTYLLRAAFTTRRVIYWVVVDLASLITTILFHVTQVRRRKMLHFHGLQNPEQLAG